MGVYHAQDPIERLGLDITRMNARLDRLERSGVWIPIVDSDLAVDQGNIWLFQDGRINLRLANGNVVRVATTTGTGTSSTPKPAPPPQPKTYSKTYAPSWSAAYKSNGGKRSDTSNLYYGYGDGYNGRQTSLIGFPYSTIQSNLSGSTIKKVELYLHNVYSWWNNGSTIYFGMHNATTEPGSLPALVRSLVSKAAFGKNQAKWVSISTEFGTRLRSGSIKGIALQAPNNDQQFYGYAAPSSPRLRITYVK